MTNAIELHGIGKRYRQSQQGSTTLLHSLARLGFGRRTQSDLWALRDINLTVEQGETIGVIGRNGSGKTTLLRLLSGVSAPSVGRLRVVGSIAPLIGVGVGFNPELTGRENVFVNARLLGMSNSEVVAAYDSIVDFSEIEKFIDTPVKFYSSGMFLRLAFAVAIHMRPEILVVDEVLAVGDLAFQMKCTERMREIQRQGTTIVIVTHNLHTLDRTAPRTIVLSHGQMVFDGPTERSIAEMHQVMQRETRARGDETTDLQMQSDVGGTFVGGAEVDVDVFAANGRRERSFATGDQMVVRINATFEGEVTDPTIGLMVSPVALGTPAYTTHTFPGAYGETHGPGRPLQADVTLDVRLLAGGYSIKAGVFAEGGKLRLGESDAESVYVTSVGLPASGFVDLNGTFTIEGRPVVAPELRRLGERNAPRARRTTGAQRGRGASAPASRRQPPAS